MGFAWYFFGFVYCLLADLVGWVRVLDCLDDLGVLLWLGLMVAPVDGLWLLLITTYWFGLGCYDELLMFDYFLGCFIVGCLLVLTVSLLWWFYCVGCVVLFGVFCWFVI